MKKIGFVIGLIFMIACSSTVHSQTRACLITSGTYTGYVFGYNALTGIYDPTDYSLNYCQNGATTYWRTTNYLPTESCYVALYGNGIRVSYTVANCPLDLNFFTAMLLCIVSVFATKIKANKEMRAKL